MNHPLDDEVPPNVLDELSVAFGEPEPPPVYDFDDPNIDALLGIDASGPKAPPDPGLVRAAANAPSGAASGTSADESDGEHGRRVIIIEEDDFPDAMYLDEAAEVRLRDIHGDPDGDGVAPIIIGNADEGAPIEQVPTTSRPKIDPRVRARRIAVGRAKGRRRLVVVAALVGVLALVIGTLAVLGSSWFEVRDVRVQGASYSEPDVDKIVGAVRGDPVLLVDTVDLERQLERVAWIEAARVSTDFPHGLDVDIRERTPIAYFVGSDGQARVIDRDSRVLAVLRGAPVQYPQITGPAPDSPVGAFSGELYAGAANVVQALPPEIRQLLKSVGADSSAGVLTLELTNGIAVKLGEPRDITRKLARLLIVLRQPGDLTCTAIDVTTADASGC